MPAVAVVNETLASRLWPGLAARQVVGRRVRIAFDPSEAPREVVGVVDNVRSRRPDARPIPSSTCPLPRFPRRR